MALIKRGRRRESRGQATVEFALVAFPLVLLMVGLFDLGRAVWSYTTIAEASRTGARVAIVDQDETAIKTAAVDQASTRLGVGVTDADVTIVYTNVSANGQLGAPCSTVKVWECVAEVTVTYDYTPATPLIGNVLLAYLQDPQHLGSIRMSATTKIPVEHTSP